MKCNSCDKEIEFTPVSAIIHVAGSLEVAHEYQYCSDICFDLKMMEARTISSSFEDMDVVFSVKKIKESPIVYWVEVTIM